MSRQLTYDPAEGEFVDFATLDDWEAQDKTKDGRIQSLVDDVERLRYVLGGVRDAIKTGRNEPLVTWKEQIDIALGEGET